MTMKKNIITGATLEDWPNVVGGTVNADPVHIALKDLLKRIEVLEAKTKGLK